MALAGHVSKSMLLVTAIPLSRQAGRNRRCPARWPILPILNATPHKVRALGS
jgi:hypothetical protein